MTNSIEKRLEKYTLQHPQQVLLLTTETEGQEDQILIFKGFSSSLTGATSFDPDQPILSPSTTIKKIDILSSPYNPNSPHYLQQSLTPEQIEHLLINSGII